ncbi:MAG TPA: VWA domain-containing protein [Thermoanaerobaculia bacterium]|jgi:VWFA-related protein|nr:VWA domain-containing protein [Thermoanaerobaculia bacterium]
MRATRQTHRKQRRDRASLIGRIPGWILGILILLPAGAGAQTHHEVVTVEVVDVPVYVISHGKPVRDLTKGDFELFVNDKRQPIEYFERIDFAAAAAPAPAEARPATMPVADPRERRLFLLLFDLAYNRPPALARAQKAAATMVDRALPQDFFAVATYNSQGANFIIPFTRDHDVIRRAVLKLSPSSARDALAISITNAERQTAEAWVPLDSSGAGGRGLSGEEPMTDLMAGFAVQDHARAQTLAQSQLDEFSMIASRLAGLEGYKHAVLFSEGFSSSLYEDGPGAPDAHMARALQSMAESFHAAGAILDTVDLGVVGNDVIVTGQTAPSYSSSGQAGTTTNVRRYDESKDSTLFTFAAKTGGQFLHWTNDFTAALADLSASVSAGYRLGFKPVNPRKGPNKIDVRVKNIPRGATISFRKGFSSAPESPDASDALLLADIIQNDIPQTGTPPAFSFTERPFIDVVVPARLLAKELGAIDDAKLMLYIFDGKGDAVDYREKKISIPATTTADMAIRLKLALPPGKYVAKALLRVSKSLGFAKVAFTVPVER